MYYIQLNESQKFVQFSTFNARGRGGLYMDLLTTGTYCIF